MLERIIRNFGSKRKRVDTDTVQPPILDVFGNPADELTTHSEIPRDSVIILQRVSAYYPPQRRQPEKVAVKDVSLDIARHDITALIGPSGCGKSTLLRLLNRMHELTLGAYHGGDIFFNEQDIYHGGMSIEEIRTKIGMVFQKPNPFSKSIYDNVAFGVRLKDPRVHRDTLDEIVEKSLKAAYLWDEVKGDLKKSGLSLSGGQQQRLCIARTLAVDPEVILMDEPCASLDPVATKEVEDVMLSLKENHTIVIVTHKMEQAVRVSTYTGFLSIRRQQQGNHDSRWGILVQFGRTQKLFDLEHGSAVPELQQYLRGDFG